MTTSPGRHSAAATTEQSALLARARTGDEDAFTQIVVDNSDRVYRALRRFGLTPGDAEEVAQEVFVRAWRSLDRFEGRSQLSTWLYRIAFNEAQRRLAHAEPAGITPDPGAEDPVLGLPDTPEHGPVAQTLQHEFSGQLSIALAALPADLRVAVVLRDLEGLSAAEAAQVVGMGQAAFKSRLHRGRMQLRTLLAPYLTPEST